MIDLPEDCISNEWIERGGNNVKTYKTLWFHDSEKKRYNNNDVNKETNSKNAHRSPNVFS